MPLAVPSRQSSHSQDTTGAAVASSGNYLLTMFISLGWQNCNGKVRLKGRAYFLQLEHGVAAGPEFLSILWSVSCFVLVFTHSDGVKNVKGQREEWAAVALRVTKPARLPATHKQLWVFKLFLVISQQETAFQCPIIFTIVREDGCLDSKEERWQL